MRSYRLLLLDRTGLVVGTRSIERQNDQAAIQAAEREVRRCEHVEIWAGGRPVCVCSRPLRPSFDLTEGLRRWRLFWSEAFVRGRWQTCRATFSRKHGV